MKRSILFKTASIATLAFPVFFMTACLDNHKPAKSRPGTEPAKATTENSAFSKIDLSKCVTENDKSTLDAGEVVCVDTASKFMNESSLSKLAKDKSIALKKQEDKSISSIELTNDSNVVWNNEMLLQTIATMDAAKLKQLEQEFRKTLEKALNRASDEANIATMALSKNSILAAAKSKDKKSDAKSQGDAKTEDAKKTLDTAMKALENGAGEHQASCSVNLLLKKCGAEIVDKEGLSARDQEVATEMVALASKVSALIESDLNGKKLSEVKESQDLKRLGPVTLIKMKLAEVEAAGKKTEATKTSLAQAESEVKKRQALVDEKTNALNEIIAAIKELDAKIADEKASEEDKAKAKEEKDQAIAQQTKLNEELENAQKALKIAQEALEQLQNGTQTEATAEK